jgi:hypothetical protein
VEKKSEPIRINSTNPPLVTWDQDKMSNYEFEKKKQFSITNCLVGRKPWKNNQVKYTTVKQLKTQTMQTK